MRAVFVLCHKVKRGRIFHTGLIAQSLTQQLPCTAVSVRNGVKTEEDSLKLPNSEKLSPVELKLQRASSKVKEKVILRLRLIPNRTRGTENLLFIELLNHEIVQVGKELSFAFGSGFDVVISKFRVFILIVKYRGPVLNQLCHLLFMALLLTINTELPFLLL